MFVHKQLVCQQDPALFTWDKHISSKGWLATEIDVDIAVYDFRFQILVWVDGNNVTCLSHINHTGSRWLIYCLSLSSYTQWDGPPYPLGTARPIYRTGTPLPSKLPIVYVYIFSTNIRTEFFKHAAHSPFFLSSKCCLFHNATFFGSCINSQFTYRVC
jgi:hypothetical protein